MNSDNSKNRAGRFRLTVTGTAGQTCRIEAAPVFPAWTVVGTVTATASGSLNRPAGNAAKFPRRGDHLL